MLRLVKAQLENSQNSWITRKWFSMDAGSSSKCSFWLRQAPRSSRVFINWRCSLPTHALIGSHTSYGVTWAWIATPLEASSPRAHLSVTQVSLPPGCPPSSQYISETLSRNSLSSGSAWAPASSYTIWLRTTHPLLKPTMVRVKPAGRGPGLDVPLRGGKGLGGQPAACLWPRSALRWRMAP